jgi:hypothetical protein
MGELQETGCWVGYVLCTAGFPCKKEKLNRELSKFDREPAVFVEFQQEVDMLSAAKSGMPGLIRWSMLLRRFR